MIQATKAIGKGEELFVSYGKGYWILHQQQQKEEEQEEEEERKSRRSSLRKRKVH